MLGNNPGAPGVMQVQQSGIFAADNNTAADYSDGYVIGRAGTAQLSVGGVNARVAVRQRLLVASGGGDMDFISGNPGSNRSGTATMSVAAGGSVAVSELRIGVTGTGTLTQTGGAIAADNASPVFAQAGIGNGIYGQAVYVGSQAGANGVYNQSGGSVSVVGDLVIGNFGNGWYDVSGSATATVGGALAIGRMAGSTGAVTISGGTISQTPADNGIVVGDAGTGSLIMNGGLVIVGGTLSKGASGTINLNAGGRLQIGAGGSSGELATSVTNDGTLIFNRSDDSSYGNVIGGSGNIVKQGAGVLGLSGLNTVTGTTTISGGSIRLDNAGALAGSSVVPASGGKLSVTPYLEASVARLAPNAGGLTDVSNAKLTV